MFGVNDLGCLFQPEWLYVEVKGLLQKKNASTTVVFIPNKQACQAKKSCWNAASIDLSPSELQTLGVHITAERWIIAQVLSEKNGPLNTFSLGAQKVSAEFSVPSGQFKSFNHSNQQG